MRHTAGRTFGRMWDRARRDIARPALPAAQPPWMLYGMLLLILCAAVWKMLDVAGAPATSMLLPFQLAAAQDDLAGLRMAWMNCADDRGIGQAEQRDLDGALAIATQQGYVDIVSQLHRWGVTGCESCASLHCQIAECDSQPAFRPASEP